MKNIKKNRPELVDLDLLFSFDNLDCIDNQVRELKDFPFHLTIIKAGSKVTVLPIFYFGLKCQEVYNVFYRFEIGEINN
jgi:hypothetical protein